MLFVSPNQIIISLNNQCYGNILSKKKKKVRKFHISFIFLFVLFYCVKCSLIAEGLSVKLWGIGQEITSLWSRQRCFLFVLKNENRKKREEIMAILCLYTNGTSTDSWLRLLGDIAYRGPIILIFFSLLECSFLLLLFLSLSLFLSFLLEEKERKKVGNISKLAKMGLGEL